MRSFHEKKPIFHNDERQQLVTKRMYDKRMEQRFLSLGWNKQLTYCKRGKELS